MRRDRVLVVDDEPGMLRAVGRVLGGRHEVTACASAVEALASVAERRPDLAILDVRMPGMSGFELMKRLKQGAPPIDVILMTGSVGDADAKLVRAIREDAFYFIQKPFDREVLETLVERCLQSRRLREANRRHVARLEAELDAARSFQRSLLPPRRARFGGVSLDCLWTPSAELGGDFYDYALGASGELGFLVADVVGHGAAAAMLTGVVKAAFLGSRGDGYDPLAVVDRIAAGLEGFGPQRFVTAFAGLVSADRSQLSYVSAGHPAALLCGRERESSALGSTGLLISPAFPSVARRKQEVALEPGDCLLVYTDGVLEAGSDEDPFGAGRLRALASERPLPTGESLVSGIARALREFLAGRPQADDWTLLALERE